MVFVGAIADDFTGALDLANNFARAGLRVVHLNGVAVDTPCPPDVDAVVIATKTRTAPVAEAVTQVEQALEWLRARAAQKIYIKYCSTFDSTPQGNIGPTVDVVMQRLGTQLTVAAPAFPATGRTVYRGHLFVSDVLLSESSMRDHPLTPMTDANVVRALSPQTRHTVASIAVDEIDAGPESLKARIEDLRRQGVGIVVMDTVFDRDLDTIAEAVADLPLITGSSGLASALPRAWKIDRHDVDDLPPAQGSSAVIAGSVSQTTNQQVQLFNGPKFHLDPQRLMAGEDSVTHALDWAKPVLASGATPLIYSTAAPDAVAQAQALTGPATVGAAVERSLAQVARGLVEGGVRQLVVAGGETSGACVTALGIRELRIGRQIDPGVPWAYGQSTYGGLHLALKSGNFGRPDFFTAAFEDLT